MYALSWDSLRCFASSVARACLKACGLSFFFTLARLPRSCKMARTLFEFITRSCPVLSKCFRACLLVPVDSNRSSSVGRESKRKEQEHRGLCSRIPHYGPVLSNGNGPRPSVTRNSVKNTWPGPPVVLLNLFQPACRIAAFPLVIGLLK